MKVLFILTFSTVKQNSFRQPYEKVSHGVFKGQKKIRNPNGWVNISEIVKMHQLLLASRDLKSLREHHEH